MDGLFSHTPPPKKRKIFNTFFKNLAWSLDWLPSLLSRYTSKILLAAIDENHKGAYDFLYLPIDFEVPLAFVRT